MNPIDAAIREGLLECWIYTSLTQGYWLDRLDSPLRANRPSASSFFRSSMANEFRDMCYCLETHKEQHRWDLQLFFSCIASNERQKQMTE